MQITKLRLQNFRDFKKKEFDFGEGTTLIVGPNAIGKSSILEGIYLLASGKSFRAGVEAEMINFNEEIGRVKGRVDNGEATDLEVVLTKGEVGGEKTARKKYLVNGVSRRMNDFVGKLKAVYFGPEDLDLVTGSPSSRRHYLDAVLSQVDHEYARSSLSYEKGVRQRNKLLEKIRDEGAPRTQLIFWDQLLIKNGNYITEKRREFIEAVSLHLFPEYNFKLEYDHSIISPARLADYAEEEVAAATTLVGPHRDDFSFIFKKRELASFGSRGEQRLSILWLKLSELEFVSAKSDDRPILLLDDIFSELDHSHRDLVLEVIPKQQTIVTTADIHLVNKKALQKVEILELGS